MFSLVRGVGRCGSTSLTNREMGEIREMREMREGKKKY
jgi:hypothetical protein